MSTLTISHRHIDDLFIDNRVEAECSASQLFVTRLVTHVRNHMSSIANGDYDSNPGHPMPELPSAPFLSDDQIETGDPNEDYHTPKPEPTGGWILPGE